jgi:hypothetical protein
MRFFNIDTHVAVIEDVAELLGELGHTVDSHNMSDHTWTRGQKSSMGYGPFKKASWSAQIHQPDIGRTFYEACPELGKYDGFIVTPTAAFSLLYEFYGKPIIVVAATRYESPFTNSPERWRWLNDYLIRMTGENRLTVVANNLYDADYCDYFTGLKPRVIPSCCSYIERYAPKWEPGHAGHMTFGLSRPQYDYKDLSRCRFHFNYPYNASTMSFFERYWLNIPQLVVNPTMLMEAYHDGSVPCELSFGGIVRSPIPAHPSVRVPLDPNSPPCRAAWAHLHDHYVMRHIGQFDGREEKERLYNDLNPEKISEHMMLHNVYRRATALARWKMLLEGLYS